MGEEDFGGGWVLVLRLQPDVKRTVVATAAICSLFVLSCC